LSFGVRDVLRKPLTARALRASLISALDEVRYRQTEPQPIALPRPAAPDSAPDRAAAPIQAAPPVPTEFDVLYAIGKSVVSLVDLEEILRRVVEAAIYVSSAEQGYLMLLDEDSDDLVIRAAKNVSEQFARTLRLRASDSMAGKAVKTGKPIFIGGEQMTKIKTSFLVRSILYVPLKVSNKIIGVLTVSNPQVPRDFTRADLRIVSAIADYAAIAIDKAQLYQEARDRAAAYEAVYKELEEADQVKSQMIQNLSHELRTPLIFIQGYIYLLTSGSVMALPPDVKENLLTAQGRVDDLIKIADNLRVLSEPAKPTVFPKPVALSVLMQRALDRRADDAKKVGVSIVCDIPPASMIVMADPDEMEHVIGNLLDNATKFSPNGGLVTITTRSLPKKQVEIAVTDSGVGIPQEKLDRVFDRFYQVDGTLTRRFGGVGLGLSAAREIVRAHGGELTVSSKVGEGSVFRFTLPLADASAPTLAK
jgi:signal transduction histidine kinase